MSNYAVLGDRCSYSGSVARVDNQKFLLPFNDVYSLRYTNMYQYPAQVGLMRRGQKVDKTYFGKNTTPTDSNAGCSTCGTY